MVTKKKLLYFGFNNHYGGAQRSTAEVLGRICDVIDVHVIDAYGVSEEFKQAVQENKCTYKVLFRSAKTTNIGYQGHNKFRRIMSILLSLSHLTLMSYKLNKFVRHIKPDVILVNDYKSLHVLTLALGFCRIPIIYYLRGNYLPQQIGLTTRLIFRFLVKHLIAVSTVTKENVCKSKICPEKVSIVFNPVDIEEVDKRSKLPLVSDLPRITAKIKLLLPGTLIPGKGQICAVRALRLLLDKGYDAILWMAGDVPLEANPEYLTSLKSEIHKLGLENKAICLGWREDILPIMSEATIVLLPSHSEGMPRCILEAMAINKPVIATAVGGIPNLIKDGQTGLLADVGDTEGFAEAVEKLLDSDFANQVSVNAKEYIREYCGTRTQRSLILNVINKFC